MLYLMKIEFKKYILNKKVFVVGVLAIAFFIFQIYTMGATIHSAHSLGRNAPPYINTLEKVRSIYYPAAEINDKFIDFTLSEYKECVDKNMSSNEEIESYINKYEINQTLSNVLQNKYNPDYRNLVFIDEKKEGKYLLISYFDIKFMDIERKERLQEELKKNFREEKYNYQGYDYLSETQRDDMIKLMQKNILDKPYIRGYSLGFDYLSSNMQFLPFTLGILLLVSLYGMFGTEKLKKTDTIILTSKEGKRKYICAKLLTIFLYASALWILFQLINLIGCYLIFTLEGANVSVYSFFFDSVYGFNYLEYVLHQLPISYLGTLLVAYIIAFASQLLKTIPTLTLGAIWIFLSSFIPYSLNTTGYSLLTKLTLLSPTQMMSSFTTYSEYVPYNILGINIDLPSLTYIILILGLFICITGLYFTTRNRQIKG